MTTYALWRRPCLTVLALTLFVSVGGAATIPAPGDQHVEIVVSGRTTTLKRVDIAAVGREIPKTFSGKFVRNTEGFTWYVSKHYALKTDYDAGGARAWLELLEMAYPHYVALFGSEPADIATTRMAVIYATSADSLAVAIASDKLQWDFNGGGITFEQRRAAYQFPSGTLDYHRRYILLHECTHLFQMCLAGTVHATPAWYYEGIADSLGLHVYDSARRRLTVNVLDRAPTVNLYDRGLAALRESPLSASQINLAGQSERGVDLLLVSFLNSTPDRMHRFRLWRDAAIGRGPTRGRSPNGREQATDLLGELFGGWAKLDADFKAWWTARRSTFHYVRWGWEQDGEAMQSYGFSEDGMMSQTDVNLLPGAKPVDDPLVMDYPHGPVSPLVGPVARGGAAPSVGAMVDFSSNADTGSAGLALGVMPGWPVTPLDRSKLYVDRNGNVRGVGVVTYKLKAVDNEGRGPDDVKAGVPTGSHVDAEIALGLPRSPTAEVAADFVVEWKSYLRVEADATVDFATFSDEGSWLWIDDKLVVDNGGIHSPQVRTGRVALKKGLRKIRVRYFQMRGGRTLAVGYKKVPRPGSLEVYVRRERDLVIDGSDIAIPLRSYPLPKALCAAALAGGHRYGLTVTIAPKAVNVTVRTRDPKAGAPVAFTVSAPINATQRKRLLESPGAVIARGGTHRVTPYFAPARHPAPDLAIPANPDRWRNCADPQLAALYRAAHALAKHAPPSLLALRKRLLAAADQPPATQQAALAHFHKTLPAVRADIAQSPADKALKARILADLDSVSIAKGLPVKASPFGGAHYRSASDPLRPAPGARVPSKSFNPPRQAGDRR